MKPEDHAWHALREHAAAHLRPGFADRVLRAARGPDAAAWAQLNAHAAAQLRPGFAARVLRAARAVQHGMPSLFGQFAFGAATAAVCLLTVVYFHSRALRAEEERNLAGWQQLAADLQDFDPGS
jgi:hypothetical protein